jgi:hypothetical protein
MSDAKQDTGHWDFPFDFNPDDFFGFTYRITEVDTGMEYVGKCQFHQHLRVKVKDKVRKKKVVKESKWKSYTGSSVRLNLAITEKGIENYRFEILSLHETRSSLVYAEVLIQITENVLRERLANGSRKFYNGLISGIKFIPPEETLIESQMKRRRV